MAKWHINKHGNPAPCNAKDGNCPLGGEDTHFQTKEETQNEIELRGRAIHGILPNVERKACSKVAKTEEEIRYVEKRKIDLAKESQFKTYIERCRSCRKIENYHQEDLKTRHFNEDRQDKTNGLIETFGEGNSLGVYEVDHLMGTYKREAYKKQMIELLDNGRIIVYDYHTKRTVTSFMAHKSRIETMMILNNEIPDKSFLKTVTANKREAERLNLS